MNYWSIERMNWWINELMKGWIDELLKYRILMETNIWNFDFSSTSLGFLDVPKENLRPIGSAVLTFIRYKQTIRQPDKSNLYIDYMNFSIKMFLYRRCTGTRHSVQLNCTYMELQHHKLSNSSNILKDYLI
jgi:hypothetical protein